MMKWLLKLPTEKLLISKGIRTKWLNSMKEIKEKEELEKEVCIQWLRVFEKLSDEEQKVFQDPTLYLRAVDSLPESEREKYIFHQPYRNKVLECTEKLGVQNQWKDKIYKTDWTENFCEGVDLYGLDRISPCNECGTYGVTPDGEDTLRCLACGQKGYIVQKPVTVR